jgi:hypothetical protein
MAKEASEISPGLPTQLDLASIFLGVTNGRTTPVRLATVHTINGSRFLPATTRMAPAITNA